MKIELLVFRRPNMFNVNDNMFNMIGYGELKNMFTIENYKTKHSNLTLYYPERFLNVTEERLLIERCEKAGYEGVKIVTHSVYIIQTVKHNNIKIVNDAINDGDFKVSNDYVGLPDDSGLNVL